MSSVVGRYEYSVRRAARLRALAEAYVETHRSLRSSSRVHTTPRHATKARRGGGCASRYYGLGFEVSGLQFRVLFIVFIVIYASRVVAELCLMPSRVAHIHAARSWPAPARASTL